MRGLKALVFSAALLVPLAMMPPANAQVSITIGGPPPVCQYGYYDYAPYGCAPYGFYGPGYFYNGIFLGVGPWAHWGYRHGWGSHRFRSAGGGRYRPGYRPHGGTYRPHDNGRPHGGRPHDNGRPNGGGRPNNGGRPNGNGRPDSRGQSHGGHNNNGRPNGGGDRPH